jgi:hypothetical protein
MWASDFLHTDCTWPNSLKVIDGQFAGLPEQTRNKIVCQNVAKLYRIAFDR